MLYRSIMVSGAGFIKNMDFWAREGSMFDDFVAEKIDWIFFRPARHGDGPPPLGPGAWHIYLEFRCPFLGRFQDVFQGTFQVLLESE